ncbi:MAG: hypothetical protein IPP47_25640 [Bryobacterales bacterium]|nr:hypothetical protein [Bryobacterales bacterium]
MRTHPNSKPIVRVKAKFQVHRPQPVGTLEAGIGRGGVNTLIPKSLIDRHVAEGMADLKAGRVHGPYRSAEEAVAALDERAAGAGQ